MTDNHFTDDGGPLPEPTQRPMTIPYGQERFAIVGGEWAKCTNCGGVYIADSPAQAHQAFWFHDC